MADLKTKHQRPEGKVLEQAMRRPPGMSARELARRIGMSDARVRQILNGYASQSGQILSVNGPTETVARMAVALDVAPEEMSRAGRDDVASFMVEMQERSSLSSLGDRNLDVDALADLVADSLREAVEAAVLAAIAPSESRKPPIASERRFDRETLLLEAYLFATNDLPIPDDNPFAGKSKSYILQQSVPLILAAQERAKDESDPSDISGPLAADDTPGRDQEQEAPDTA